MEEEIIKKELPRVMTFLNFDKNDSNYECACNKINKNELIKILKEFKFKETQTDWYHKGDQSINVNHLVSIVKLFEHIRDE